MRYLLLLTFCSYTSLSWSQQRTIDFENQPALTQQAAGQAPCAPAAPLSAGPATFTGGTAISLAANQNTVYWTAQGCSAWQRVLTIQFAQPVSNAGFLLGTSGAAGTFTVQDDVGDAAQVNLAISASTFVSLPGQNVRQVTVTPAATTGWSYYLDNITYTPATPSITLLDPVPELQAGNSIVTDPGLLSIAGTPAAGVAADSAARLVIRIDANSIGEQLTLALLNDQGAVSGNAGDDGQLGTIDGGKMGGQMQLTAVHTIEGPMAFAIYYPPEDFVRGNSLSDLLSALPLPLGQPGASDAQSATRSVTLRLTSLTVKGSTTSTPVVLARPPAMLVHGLWSGPAAWNGFTAVVNDAARRFFVARANYDESLDSRVLSATPAYASYSTNASALGFAFNAPAVWEQAGKEVLAFRREKSIAAAQVDMIAHDMGGTVARTLEGLPGFAGTDSFGAGSLHKLITIGTPNFGTPLALQLLSQGDVNACTRNWLAESGRATFQSATLDNAANVVAGGIGDLRGDGRGDDLGKYPALSNLRVPNGHSVPTAMVAAVTLPANLNSLACPGSGGACVLRQLCGSDPLAQALSPSGWYSIFGLTNDGFVPLTSQLNGFLPIGYVFPGIVHSNGMEFLGFSGPAELDDTKSMQPAVVQLLNAAVHALGFMPLP